MSDALTTVSDIAALSRDVLLVIAFPKSTAQGYAMALELAQTSGGYRQAMLSGKVINIL